MLGIEAKLGKERLDCSLGVGQTVTLTAMQQGLRDLKCLFNLNYLL